MINRVVDKDTRLDHRLSHLSRRKVARFIEIDTIDPGLASQAAPLRRRLGATFYLLGNQAQLAGNQNLASLGRNDRAAAGRRSGCLGSRRPHNRRTNNQGSYSPQTKNTPTRQ